jgi:hypothetical protein
MVGILKAASDWSVEGCAAFTSLDTITLGLNNIVKEQQRSNGLLLNWFPLRPCHSSLSHQRIITEDYS